MYNNQSIVLNELIGLRAKIVKCADKKQVGLEGIVLDETKNTLLLETEKGMKRIVKKTSVFRFYVDKKSYVVDGVEINFRPHARIEKAMKFYKRRKP